MAFSKSDFVLLLEGLVAGIGKHYAGATLQVEGKSLAEITSTFQTCIDACAAVAPAEVAHAAAVDKADAAVAQAQPLAKAVKALALAQFGSDATVLADFSLKPHKAPAVSTETRAAAAKKAAATRKALGTKGSRQKKDAKKALAAAQGEPAAAPAPAPAPAPKS